MAVEAGGGSRLESALGHRFLNAAHLRRALTHSSHAHERGEGPDNEALEFLGDALLGFLVAEALCARHPAMDEGGLSKLKAFLVSRPSLAAIARDLDLGRHLRLGKAAARGAAQETDSILADALEAVLAAVHLDGGDAAARRVVGRLFGPRLADLNPAEVGRKDHKTVLQENLQAAGRPTPRYRVGKTEGPPHRPVFHVDLLVDGEVVAHGQGGSKKEAEQAAARQALRLIGPAPPAPKRK